MVAQPGTCSTGALLAMSTRAIEAHRFETTTATLVGSVVPALEACAQSMRSSGLGVSVSHGTQTREGRIGRCFEAALAMGAHGEHGPARLTLSVIEGDDVVRVALLVGPDGRERQHHGAVSGTDLTDEMVGGLVATLVDRAFDTPEAREG